jgi:hypothetical protein
LKPILILAVEVTASEDASSLIMDFESDVYELLYPQDKTFQSTPYLPKK